MLRRGLHLARLGAVAVVVWITAVCGAAAQGYPALYDVTGVAANDVLNVRQGPSANTPIIDRLEPFETDVEVLRLDPTGRWARVAAGEQMGWASLRFLERQAGQFRDTMADQLWCHGTEPFWDLNFVAGGDTRLGRLDAEPLVYEMSPLAPAAGRVDAFGALGRGPSGVLSISVTPQSCSDGMSDLEFGLATILIFDGVFGTDVLSGCCSLR